MKTIYKYKLNVIDKQIIKTPQYGIILSVQEQDDQLCLWVQVDTEAPEVERIIRVIGTGNHLPDNLCYIGTVQQKPYVWHIYEDFNVPSK